MSNGGLAGFLIFRTHELTDFQEPARLEKLRPLAPRDAARPALRPAAGLLLLSSWRTRLFATGDDRARLPLAGEVLLYAALPLFHLHTFLFLSLLLGAWLVLFPPLRKKLAALVGLSFLPATALVLLVTGGLHGTSVLGWKAGWMWDDDAFLKWSLETFGRDDLPFAALTFGR